MSVLGQAPVLAAIWRPLVTFVLASVAIMGSPGPSTISATAVGAAYGFRQSIVYVCGLILGTISVLAAVAMGVMAIVLSIPHGASALVAVSIVYMFYLAFRIATAPPLADQRGHAATPGVVGGFLLAIANPKAHLAIAAVFAGTSILHEDRAFDAVIKTALLSVMIVIIHLCWLFVGTSLTRVLRKPVSSRVVNILLAISLTIVSFRLCGDLSSSFSDH
jgi:threonine/homoserine/homoserine lactone efflux protein